MNGTKKRRVALLIVGLFVAASVCVCGPIIRDCTQKTVISPVSTDIAALQQWLDLSILPQQPQAVQWVQGSMLLYPNCPPPGPSDYFLMAVLTYDEPTAAFAMGLTAGPGLTIESRFLGDWLPPSISEQFRPATGDTLTAAGGTYIAPDGLLLMPFQGGTMIFVDEYVFVYGITM